jgi:hypothetical protein
VVTLVSISPLTPVQIAVLVTFLATLVVGVALCALRPSLRGYVLPFWLLSLHGAVYYTVLQWSALTGRLPFWYPAMDFQDWSAALRLHAALTVFGHEAYILVDEIRKRRRGR